ITQLLGSGGGATPGVPLAHPEFPWMPLDSIGDVRLWGKTKAIVPLIYRRRPIRIIPGRNGSRGTPTSFSTPWYRASTNNEGAPALTNGLPSGPLDTPNAKNRSIRPRQYMLPLAT